jgi:LacI family transcriptional regulator, repressor for deo operon, udp, cdd, tsx, nupC, and nupG
MDSAGVTIDDVARRAGVSVATVSRALRSLPNVSAATRHKVEAAAAELDYHIDRTASRLATGRTETVGVVVPMLDAWYFSRVMSGIEAILSEAGYDVLVTSVTDEAARHRLASGNAPLRKRVDGLIFVDVLLTPDEISALDQTSLHIVTVGQRTGAFPAVTIDNRGAARDLVAHLVDLGHRRVGFVAGGPAADLPFSVPGERRDGYADGLDKAGVGHDEGLEVWTGFTLAQGAAAARQLLEMPDAPTAIFAASDVLAFGALQAARELGRAVPGELSVAGFDDREVSSAMDLTTVHQDPAAQGRAAAALLLEEPARRDHSETLHEIVAETRLVLRGTTAAPPP